MGLISPQLFLPRLIECCFNIPRLSTLKEKAMSNKDDLLAKFGERVRTLRKEKTKYSQEGFAFYIGMERSQYSKIERGLKDVRLTSVARIAFGLGLTPSELLDGIATDDETLYEIKEIKKKN